MLINVPQVYNDEEERRNTHPKLLELAQDLEKAFMTIQCWAPQHRRSVLGKEQKQVTWKQNTCKLDVDDSKVCMFHLEAVKVRIVARHAETSCILGRE